ncbi:hypothetical protein HHI36_014020 [Cryptolaemus montrouzieri]|uniref:Lipid droplet-associated hydrolase n=1 Tax=Cryptolaemus montrouzieri TaxID=559131 RepID=A0ABD2N1I9_9CUCU
MQTLIIIIFQESFLSLFKQVVKVSFSKMQEGFVDINNVPTLVTTYGRWITDKPEKNGTEETIILIIPANNGSTGFYRPFMKILHMKYNCPVWIVANSGHDIPPGKDMPEKILGLKEQTRQKVTFFENYIPEDAKVHLIGHSVGCHMVLEMLKVPQIERKVNKAHLLFPLIERLQEGKKGMSLKKNEKYQFLLIFVLWLFYILPEIISGSLLKAFKIPGKDVPFILSTFNPKVLKQVLLVASDELEQVNKRDNDVIKKNINKLRMLYAEGDGWLPSTCYDDLLKDFPKLKADMSHFEHAFYMKSSHEVAEIVSKWISEPVPRYY